MFSTLITAATVFSLFGSAELQSWNSVESPSSSTKETSVESNDDINQTIENKVPTTN